MGEVILDVSCFVPWRSDDLLPVRLLIATPRTSITGYSKHGSPSGCGKEERATQEVEVSALAVRTHLMSCLEAAQHARQQMGFLGGVKGRVY